MSFIKELLKPLSYYVNLSELKRRIFSMNVNDILAILEDYDMYVLPLDKTGIYVVKDYETRHRDYLSVSDILSENVITLAFKHLTGIKLFTESDLRRIAYGILVHQAYYQKLITVPQLQVEQLVVDHKKKMVGRVDVLGPGFVAELKSSTKPSWKHVLQAVIYAYILNINEYFIVYPDYVINGVVNDRIINIVNKVLESLRSKIDRLRSWGDIREVIKNVDFVELSKFEGKISMPIDRLISLLKEYGFL